MTSGLKEGNYCGRKGIGPTQGELLTQRTAHGAPLAGQEELELPLWTFFTAPLTFGFGVPEVSRW